MSQVPNQPPPYNPPPYNQQVPPGGYQQYPPQGGYQNFPPPPGGYQPYGSNFVGQMDHPSASTAQTCGIIGLVLFFNIIGIILNIIAIVRGNTVMSDYNNFPGRYTESSYRKGKSGRTCGIIGLSILGGGIVLIIIIAVLANAF
jgi:hypothetical protein